MSDNTDVGGGASRTTESAAGSSSATDVSLREYLAAAINESRRECRDNIQHLERRVEAIQKNNLERRREEMDDINRRFDGVNEFRNALADLSALMATKEMVGRVEEKVEGGRQAVSQRVTALERRIDLREGQDVGSRVTKGGLYTAIGAAAAGVGILVILLNWLSTGSP